MILVYVGRRVQTWVSERIFGPKVDFKRAFFSKKRV